MSGRPSLKVVASTVALVVLSACGGSSGETDAAANTTSNNVDVNELGSVAQDSLPSGNVTQFGAISIGDDVGTASDLVGGFFQLSSGIDMQYFDSLVAPGNVNCVVDSDDNIDFEEISAGYIPSLTGVGKQSISAGETIILSDMGNTYAQMTRQPAGSFIFYDLPIGQNLPTGPVPTTITVDIPGDDFPAFENITAPSVDTLTGVTFSSGDVVNPSTIFSWDAGSSGDSQVRIFTSTAGGFFLEDGMTVTCIVPDTGQFSFPSDVRSKLGADFIGGTPLMSRLSTRSEVQDNSVLFIIRESFL